ncbi:MAG: hypothetical protein U0O22_02400 [Acutalibacteraceae bacterium]|nr:hypothetical protein [Acutalibacteraceae bacterium]
MTVSLKRKATNFFRGYVDVDDLTALDKNGNFTDFALQQAVKLLVDSGIFTVEEMKFEMLHDYKIILPEWVFEKI